jgi:S1-C subfamily serine protease
VPGSTAAGAGLQAGDYLQQVGDVVVKDDDFGTQFRELYGDRKDAPLVIVVRRGSETLKLDGTVQLTGYRVEADPGASAKATRIREGILRGQTGN